MLPRSGREPQPRPPRAQKKEKELLGTFDFAWNKKNNGDKRSVGVRVRPLAGLLCFCCVPRTGYSTGLPPAPVKKDSSARRGKGASPSTSGGEVPSRA